MSALEERWDTLVARLRDEQPAKYKALESILTDTLPEDREKVLEGIELTLGATPTPKKPAPKPEPKGEPPAAPAAKLEPTTRRVATPGEQEQRLAQRLYNVIDTLSPALPPMLFLGYLHCWRLADHATGEFYISHERLAQRLGSRDRVTGKRVMRTLVVAGLVRIKLKGGPRRATVYRLTPLGQFDESKVMAAVVSTWLGKNPSQWASAAAAMADKAEGDGE